MKKNPEYGVLRAEYLQGCSVEVALNIIGGKWKGMILYTLLDGTKRFNELRQIIPGITQRMLTLQLRELEDCGIVQRVVYPEVPPRVEYSLTELGQTIKPVILQIREWGSSYKKAMGGHLKQSNSN